VRASNRCFQLCQEYQVYPCSNPKTPSTAGTLRLDALGGGGWGDHWVTGAALWLEGLERLRGGIELGDKARARGALPIVRWDFKP
jgi:hypothetical protein